MLPLPNLDRCVIAFDNALRTLTGAPTVPTRPNPANAVADGDALSAAETRRASGLMRVNHSGEICAQALYQGQALTARNAATAAAMAQAAREEADHLAWCRQRLDELNAAPSALNPIWYAGSWAIGAMAGAVNDRWSLGFVAATERQVEAHLQSHLESLPRQDGRSRAIVAQMRIDEARHADQAQAAGAAELPPTVQRAMAVTARIMTTLAYRL